MLYLISSAVRWHHFCSTPLMHWAVVVWRLLKYLHCTSISKSGYRGWGSLRSSNMTTVSLMCLLKKCTLSAVIVSAHTIHPSTGNYCGPAGVGKIIWYVCGSPSRRVVSQCCLPLASMSCWVCRCTSREPATRSTPHSGNCTLILCMDR